MARLGHLLLLAAIAPLVAACTQSHAVGLEIAGAPADGTARRFTIRVYRGATCPTMEAFARGTDSTLERVYAQDVAPSDALPPVGRLEAGPYAFATLVRDADCRVVAYGCVVADPSATGSVRVELTSVATDPRAPACEAGVACSDGVCVGTTTCDPATCSATASTRGVCCGATCADLSSDAAHCGRCDISCAPGVRCQAGTCEATPGCSADGTGCSGGTTCCTDRCVDLQTDATACGACERSCAPDLTCVAGSCLPREPAGAVRLHAPSGPMADCGPLMLVLVWLPVEPTTGLPPRLGPMVALDASTAGRETSFAVRDAVPPDGTHRCGSATDCPVFVALAQLWLVTDANRDGAISAAELRGLSLVGVVDAGIVWSSADIARTDPLLSRVLDGTRISFPEGVLAGGNVYRRGPLDAGESWIPASATDVFEVRTCMSTGCTTPVDDGCRSALPRPFGFLP